jgi:hypothetical protein
VLVKFTHPHFFTTAMSGLKSNYLQQTPGGKGIWNDWEFLINTSIKQCDLWVVHGDLDSKETVACKGPTVFILGEEVEQKIYNKDFLAQFDLVIGTQEGIEHPHYIRSQYLCAWQIEKSYDELIAMNGAAKKEELSAIISDTTFKEGHKKRFAFANQLKGHFKDRLHWYGRGNRFIEDKWHGLAPYKYSLAIENSVHPFYWTEKLADPILAYSMPVYYGCSNIENYFPEGTLILIDINDLEKSIRIIEEAMANNLYEKNYDLLVNARRSILEEYQFFPALQTAIVKAGAVHNRYGHKTLYPEKHFLPKKGLGHYMKRAIEILGAK